MIYYFNSYIKAHSHIRVVIHYRNNDGWILTYYPRQKAYGRLFRDYGYMYL